MNNHIIDPLASRYAVVNLDKQDGDEVAAMNEAELRYLHLLIAARRPDWSSQAILGSLAGVYHRFSGKVDVDTILIACLVVASIDGASPTDMGVDGGQWDAARSALLGGEGRRFSDRASRDALEEAAQARANFKLAAHEKGLADAREALRVARENKRAG